MKKPSFYFIIYYPIGLFKRKQVIISQTVTKHNRALKELEKAKIKNCIAGTADSLPVLCAKLSHQLISYKAIIQAMIKLR